MFRLNFSHGTHADRKQRLDLIGSIKSDLGQPIGVLLNLQGSKLRVGAFANGPVQLVEGERFRLDLDRSLPGDAACVAMPHPEIFAALTEGAELLLDDGRLRLRVEACGADFADIRVVNGGMLSDRKGVNVPGVVLPLSAPRMACERPRAPIIGMMPKRATARRLSLVWGVNPVLCHDVMSVAEMTEVALATAVKLNFAAVGQTIVIAAGMPFGAAGTTNLLRIAQVD